jgi:hypothetical protein
VGAGASLPFVEEHGGNVHPFKGFFVQSYFPAGARQSYFLLEAKESDACLSIDQAITNQSTNIPDNSTCCQRSASSSGIRHDLWPSYFGTKTNNILVCYVTGIKGMRCHRSSLSRIFRFFKLSSIK